MKNFSQRKGFTLVELLIVIVVIGVLSAMMMLSSTEAVSSAKATKIISDMTNLKKAVNAWYLDNYTRIAQGVENVNEEYAIKVDGKNTRFSNFIDGKGSAEFLKYISNGGSMKLGSKNSNNTADYYILRSTGKSKYWYISYYLGDGSSRLKDKLASRASSIGLKGSAKLDEDNEIKTTYTNQKYVDLLLLKLN